MQSPKPEPVRATPRLDCAQTGKLPLSAIEIGPNDLRRV